MMIPAIGINAIKIYHPLLPMSCNLRTATAKEGSKTPICRAQVIGVGSVNSIPKSIASIIPAMNDAINVSRKNHQYSDLEARPSNPTYF